MRFIQIIDPTIKGCPKRTGNILPSTLYSTIERFQQLCSLIYHAGEWPGHAPPNLCPADLFRGQNDRQVAQPMTASTLSIDNALNKR